MVRITAVYSSPRAEGNTARLTREAVRGAREAGAEVVEIRLAELEISPCQEIYGCLRRDGLCVLEDDFSAARDQLLAAAGIIFSTPIFFYTVSAQAKIFMDRFQSLWVKKYWLEKVPFTTPRYRRRGLLLAAGASQGRRLFDGALMTVRYFFDSFDTELWDSLLCRGLDGADDVLAHPEYLQEAYRKGRRLAAALAVEAPDR